MQLSVIIVNYNVKYFLEQCLYSVQKACGKIDSEIIAKQKTIDHQEQEIQRLHLLIEGKDRMVIEINEKLTECVNNCEGNRQLINKLLNDINRLQQDTEWYKRTYEKRSLPGMIREKLLRKKSKPG